MNKRMVEIYYQLLENGRLGTIKSLAELFGVSERTISNDIAELNEILSSIDCETIDINADKMPELTYNEGDKERFIKNTSFYEYSLNADERSIIIALVLMLNNAYVTLETIADFMHFSRATLAKDLAWSIEEMEKHQVAISSQKSHGLRLAETSEKNIRKLMIYIVRKHYFIAYITLRELMKTDIIDMRLKTQLPDDEKFLRIIHEAEKETEYYLTINSRQQTVFYMRLAMARILLGHHLKPADKTGETGDLRLTEAILRRSSHFIPEAYLRFDSECLNFMLRGADYIRFGEHKIDTEMIKLHIATRPFLTALSSRVQFDLNRDFQLYRGIAKSFSQSRAEGIGNIVKSGHETPAFLDASKHSYISQCILKKLPIYAEKTGIWPRDTEIDELIYFIKASIVRIENNSLHIRALLVSDFGAGHSSYLLEQLKNKLNTNDIELVISPLLDEYLESNPANLIITTEILGYRDIPMVNISSALTDTDMENIMQAIHIIKDEYYQHTLASIRYSAAFKESREILLRQQPYGDVGGSDSLPRKYIYNTYSFSDLLAPEHVETKLKAEDWEDAVRKTAMILYEKELVSKEDIEYSIDFLRRDRRFCEIGHGIAIIPLLSAKGDGNRAFAMSLAQLEGEGLKFTEQSSEMISFVSTMIIESENQYLKAIHFIENMLRN